MKFASLIVCAVSVVTVTAGRIKREDKCSQPAETGLCRANIPRWYFDADSKTCKSFIYGGCGGNANRFETKELCETACKAKCPDTKCRMYCKHGFQIDENGCEICRCNDQPTTVATPSACPTVSCLMYCQHGFQKDENGCQICRCNKAAVTSGSVEGVDKCAGRPSCQMLCADGYVKDEDGCDTCKCKDKCKNRPVCSMFCANGFKKDEDGCDVCQCAETRNPKPTCTPLRCLMYCPHDFARDENGCKICKCNERPVDKCANLPVCSMACRHGFKKNEDGCSICQCKDAPVRTLCTRMRDSARAKNLLGAFEAQCSEDGQFTPTQCHSSTGHCWCVDKYGRELPGTRKRAPLRPACVLDKCSDRPTCQLYCAKGYIKDQDGCDTCKCKGEDRCAGRPVCAMYCQHGFQKDANGCDVCKCAAAKDKCAGMPACQMQCANGFKKNEDGCDMCQCVESAPVVTMCTRMRDSAPADKAGVYRAQCTAAGEFIPRQCAGNACWCVDEYGRELPGTRKENAATPIQCGKCAGRPVCSMFCPNGFRKDADGCDICQCNEAAGDKCAKRPVCQMYCPNGFQKDADGCDICKCATATKPTCSPVMCLMRCPNGFEKDANGCDICRCATAPKPTCSPLMCLMRCPNGFQKDANGCDVCRCNDRPVDKCANRPACQMLCPNGFQKDADGCDVCRCANEPKPTCSPVRCLIYCQYDLQKDENGCTICKCNERPVDKCANRPACQMLCPNGFQKDADGCDICRCAAEPKPTCSPFMCLMRCPNGFEKDANGCDICRCAAAPKPTCSPVMCLMRCPNGFQKDANGCDICRCNDRPVDKCANRPVCQMLCPNGFQKDADGCDVCRCADQPKPTCSPVRCLIYCQYDLQKDENGCTICKCNERPVDKCANRPACQMLCPNGFQKDVDGCDICRCAAEPKPTCAPVTCYMHCEHGWQRDENGCEICKCNRPPKERCTLPSLTGPCRASLKRWFFDSASKTCKEFTYGGCNGNDNRFNSKEQCEDICKEHECSKVACNMRCERGFKKDQHGCDICQCSDVISYSDKCAGRPVCQMHCPAGFKKDVDGCDICECAPTKKEKCSMPSLTGPCRGNFKRWFYEAATKTCKEFTYGGCQGNDNRFNTREECEGECKEHECSNVACNLQCDRGFKKDTHGCDLCQCNTLTSYNATCAAVTCYMHCEYGWQRDENGCKICKCNRPPNERCTLPSVTGPCRGSFRRWFYEGSSKTCKEFIYGGCRGNGNRFNTQEECEAGCKEHKCSNVACNLQCDRGFKKDAHGCDLCQCNELTSHNAKCAGRAICQMLCPAGFKKDADGCDICECAPTVQEKCAMPSLTGPCRGSFKRWFYETSTKTCKEFVYGGCRGNDNRFNTKEECEGLCKKGKCAGRAICQMLCPAGLKKDADGCDICECAPTVQEKCAMPSLTGPCRGSFKRWFYETSTKTCKEFVYGGCRGNDNRFNTKEECEGVCKKEHACSNVACSMHCPNGFKKDAHDCDVCECAATGSTVPAHCANLPACQMACPHGFKKNVLGCHICECEEAPKKECPGVNCLMQCTHGFKKDDDGCDLCECAVGPDAGSDKSICFLPRKSGPCLAAFRRWHYDGQTSRCKEFTYGGCAPNANNFNTLEECENKCNGARNPKCYPRLACAIFCPNGFRKDADGCDMCACAQPESAVTPEPRKCSNVACSMSCEFGFKKDDNGCDICACAEKAEEDSKKCSNVACNMKCENGFKKDANGCDICACAESAVSTKLAACKLPKDSGPCYAYIKSWYFDTRHRMCKPFVYGGCQGNENRFASITECKSSCKPLMETTDAEEHDNDVCTLAVETGPCRAYLRRWHYDADGGRCKIFIFGGCQGNSNNFNTRKQCEDKCRGRPKEPKAGICPKPKEGSVGTCQMGCQDDHECPNNHKCCSNGCGRQCMAPHQDASDAVDVCSLRPVQGPCYAIFERWYYHAASKMCKPFIYGGCQGNDNRFFTKAACERRCVIMTQNKCSQDKQVTAADSVKGRKLVVTAVLQAPYVTLKKPSENGESLEGNDRFEGFLVDLLDQISSIGEFDYQIKLSTDGKYGSLAPDTGKWNGMIGELINGEADIAAANLDMTSTREGAIDFTHPIASSRRKIIVAKPGVDDAPLPASIDELLKSNYTFGIVRGGSTAAYFRGSNVEPLKQMWSKMTDANMVSSSGEGLRKVRMSQYGFITDGAAVDFVVSKHCAFVALDFEFGHQSSNSFAVSKSANGVREAINRAILKLQETDALSALKMKWWKSVC